MEILIGMAMAIGGTLWLILGLKSMTTNRQLQVIEAEKQAKLALDAQRYDKLRDIMTDSVITGQPAALEALKPMVQVMADQIRAEELMRLKQLEHEHRLALAAAQNGPFEMWMDQVTHMRQNLANDAFTLDEFVTCLETVRESTKSVFNLSLPMPSSVAETPPEDAA